MSSILHGSTPGSRSLRKTGNTRFHAFIYKSTDTVIKLSILASLMLVITSMGLAQSVVYNALTSPLPPNIPSVGYQATQTSQFGDYIHLGGTDRVLKTVTVTMSDWALYADYSGDPRYSGNSATWTHPITLNIYAAGPVVGGLRTRGPLLASRTQNVTIPWRPVADPTCANPTAWRAADTLCYNGLAFNATFDLSAFNTVLPNDLIVGVAYSTQTYGAPAIGSGGPYNSLNVGALGTAVAGSDDDTNRVFWNTSNAANYSDGGAGGVGIFREDTNWSPNGTPNFQITAGPASPATSTVVINHTDINSWLFYDDNTDKVDPTLGSFVSGPGTTPLGTGSAQISSASPDRRNLATYQFSGTPLANITTMKFSTYNPSAGNGGSANRSGYITFNVDFNGSDTFQRRLNYVPSQNGTVIQNTWQEWDAINGGNAMWSYSGATWPAAFGSCPGGGEAGTTLKSWSQVLCQYTGVRIRVTDSFFGIRVGEPYPGGYTENIDAVKFGTAAATTQFDFDPATTQTVTPAASPNAFDNDYTRINNAVQAAPAGSTVNLAGTFNWTEPNAAASWARGSDGQTGTAAFDNDNYCILPPANRNNVTITAASLGAATIQGPGDLAAVNLEGVFQYFNDGDNQNLTISNLRFLDFDLSIGMFNGAGGSDAYNGTTIQNNYIRVARDLNATVAPADTNQNIGLHYSFGTNQTITGNTFEFYGDGVSNGANFSTEVGMQSNTSGGAVYNGLQITNNTLRVMNAQGANPEVILGIWENGHAHSSTINISGNTFQNLAGGNNPATNLQRAFRVTSHSSATSTVTYANNNVSGANIGFQWISGSNFAGNQPVVVTSNTVTGGGEGFLVQSNGLANMSFNRIVGNATGVTSAAGSTVNAENNWWGCNFGPGAGGAGCSGTANGTTGAIDANPWLVLTTSASPTVIGLGDQSAITSLLTTNSDSLTPGGGFVPNGIAANFAGTFGTVSPTSSTTTSGATGTTFTATAFGAGGASTTIDGQTVNAPVTITASCVAVSAAAVQTQTGTPVTVPVSVGDVTGRGVMSSDFTITYNPAVVTSPTVTLSGIATGATLNTNTTSPGTIVVSIFKSTPFTGTGTWVDVTFNSVPGLPGSSTPISFTAFKFNEGSPCSTTSSGNVTIIGGTITGNVTYSNHGGAPLNRPVPSVTISGAGAPPVSTSTNGAGAYSLSGFGPGPYTRSASKTGGSNGAVSSFDAAKIAQHVVGLAPLTGNQLIVADVSGTGGITSFDAALIARFTVLLPGSGSAGNWIFTPASYGPSTVFTNIVGENYTALLMGDVSGNWNLPINQPGGRMAPSATTKPTTIDAPRISAPADSEIIVPVKVQGTTGRGIISYQYELRYDPAVIQPQLNPVDTAGTVSNNLLVTTNADEPGLLRVSVFGAMPLVGDGVLLNLRFTAIGAAGSISPLTWDNLILNEGGIETATTDGQVELTAAAPDQAELTGRVLTANGQPIANTRVTITNTRGESHSILTNGLGYYRFGSLHVGDTYTLNVKTREYRFNTVTVSISGQLTDVDVIAEP